MSIRSISASSTNKARTLGPGESQKSGDTVRYVSCNEHCSMGHILKVRIKDGKIIAVEPDDTINPRVPREDGYVADELIDTGMINTRPCARGFAKAAMVYDPNRVLYPMKREGKRGEGRFKRITWDEALGTIAKKMSEIKNRYGPLSIAYVRGGGFHTYPIAPWFGAGVEGWGGASWSAKAESEWIVLGRPEYPHGTERQDEGNLYKSKLIVLWGFNPTTTLANGGIYTMLRARERGIPIICIEPRLTPTASVVADQWIPIRPTTDVAMMIAMANVWFKENLCDKVSIEKWVEPEGLKRWKAYVLGTDDRVDKTPQWAENICGVPAETITDFARLYVRSKPVNLNLALSLGRSFYGHNPCRAGIYLQALSGNVGIPGGTAGAETGGEFAKRHGEFKSLPPPIVHWQRKPGPYRPPVLLIRYNWNKSIDLRDKLNKGEMTKGEYNFAIGNVPGNEPPNVKMLFTNANPVTVNANTNLTLKALQKLDFIVVFAHYPDHPTAKFADILLPTMTIFEGGGNRFSMIPGLNGNVFMYHQKCVDPPGEVKSQEWIWLQLAKRLGFADQYNPRLANTPDDKWEETIEALHKEAYEEWMKLPEIALLNPPTWEEFLKKPVFRWEVKEPYYTYKSYIESGENPFVGTASGKIEFYSKDLAKGPEDMAAHEFTSGSGKGRQKIDASRGRWYGPGLLPPMAEMTLGGKATYHSKDTEKYPLLMSSPHPLYRAHSWMDNQPLLNQDCYRHACWLSVADAKKRNIVDGDLVRVYNDVGEIVLPAYVTSRLIPGTTIVFHGAWYTPGEVKTALTPEGVDMRGCPNVLTQVNPLPETVYGHYPAKGPVEVEIWEGK